MQDLEKGNEGPVVVPLLPPLSAIRRQECARGKPPPINSWPTAGARAALPPFSPEAPPPLPFPFEDPPQSLTARRAAKPLGGAVTGAYEPLFAPRALAAKKIAITRWGMTLADLPRRRAVRLHYRGNCCQEFGCLGFNCPGFGRLEFGCPGLGHLSFGCLSFGRLDFNCPGFGFPGFCRPGFGFPGLGYLSFGCLELGYPGFGCLSALGAPASIPLVLSPPFFPHFRFLTMLLAVTFIPPPPSRLAALGAAIPGLGMSGAKWFLAAFEQTKSLARPTNPLTSSRFARSCSWAQGSC
jgi:hypothetical protein